MLGRVDRVEGVGDDMVEVHRLAFDTQLAEAVFAEGVAE